MKCSLGISNFLEEISGLSHPIVFLYFFALITEEGFLISPCYSLELCIQMGISFLFSCWKQWQTLFSFDPKSLQMMTAAMKLKGAYSLGKKAMNKINIKKQRHYFANKGLSSQSYGFSSSHVWLWESDHKGNWALKNWCFWTVVLEKTLEESLELQGDQTSQF